MVQVLYADKDILVAVKPAGVESQAAKRFAPDMVSEIRKYLVIHKLCTPGKEPYVGAVSYTHLDVSKRQVPFVTGILFENDLDLPAAEALAAHVVKVPLGPCLLYTSRCV